MRALDNHFLFVIYFQENSILVRFRICVSLNYYLNGASRVALVVKNLPTYVGDKRDEGSIPGLGRSPGGEHGNLLQYSCLENPMDRGAWRATIHRVTNN